MSGLPLLLQRGWNLVGVGRELRWADITDITPSTGPPWRWDAQQRAYRIVGPEDSRATGTGFTLPGKPRLPLTGTDPALVAPAFPRLKTAVLP